MAVAESKRAPKEAVKALTHTSRLAMIFRELAIDNKRDWRNWIIFAQHAADEGDEEMVRVVECWKGLKKREQAAATPEFVADLAGVAANDLAAEVFRSYLAYSSDAANLIEAASRPDIVRKSVQFAKTPDGHRDRKMLFEHSGFLPTKTGGGIHVNATANAETNTANVVQCGELPSMESDTARATKFFKSSEVIEIKPDAEVEAPARVPALTGA